MKRFLLLTMALIATTAMGLTAQVQTFEGARFTIQYPADFTAQGSMVSSVPGDNTFDSATFTSPDGDVTFYIYSPQGDGEPDDIDVQRGERAGKRVEKKGRRGDQVVTHWTIYATNGSYIRSYQQTRNTRKNTVWVVGIKYTNQQAYNKYKQQYLAFKASLKQLTD